MAMTHLLQSLGCGDGQRMHLGMFDVLYLHLLQSLRISDRNQDGHRSTVACQRDMVAAVGDKIDQLGQLAAGFGDRYGSL